LIFFGKTKEFGEIEGGEIGGSGYGAVPRQNK
jgi:hypothetical protein